jgi:hypothetical protein
MLTEMRSLSSRRVTLSVIRGLLLRRSCRGQMMKYYNNEFYFP